MCKIITINEVKVEHDNNITGRYIVKVFSSDKNEKIVGENLTYEEALERKREWNNLISK